MIERVERYFAHDPPPLDVISQAFWYACHGGQRSVAKYLLDQGAAVNWISTWDDLTSLDAARRVGADEVVTRLHTGAGRRPARGSS